MLSTDFEKDKAVQYTYPFSWLILPVILAGLIVLLNLRWMDLYQLNNSPKADSLVYLTEAFNDYWTFRGEGIVPLLHKYTAGNQQTSPLIIWSAGILFLIGGIDPANAYLVIGLAYVFWVVGVIFLAWQLKQDRLFALTCGLMAVFLPSVVRHGLRHFMLDFVTAAPFIWATVFLFKSDLFTRRKETIIYGLLCGIAILSRTSVMPYFLGHAAILIYLAVLRKKHPNYLNTSLAAITAVVVCGWFIFPNLSRIISYYSYWAREAVKTQTSTSFLSNISFYFNLLPSFHFSQAITRYYIIIVAIAVLILIVECSTKRKRFPDIIPPIIILALLAGIPTTILSLYPSRAATVDYPFIAAYLILPVYLWRTVFSSSKAVWIPIAILLLMMVNEQSFNLLRSPTKDARPVNFREREAIQLILNDAQGKGLSRIMLGNTCIHQHNSLSYKFWISSNYFPDWRGRVDLAAIGRAKSADELASMNSQCDYVITLDNYHEVSHPNNRLAPEANQILRKMGMRTLEPRLDLPDGTTLTLLWNPDKVKLVHPVADLDGWHSNFIKIELLSMSLQKVMLSIQAELFPLHDRPKPAVITLQSELTGDSLSFQSGFRLKNTILVPRSFFDKQGQARIILSSSWAHNPQQNPENLERRELAFRNLKMMANLVK